MYEKIFDEFVPSKYMRDYLKGLGVNLGNEYLEAIPIQIGWITDMNAG